MPVVPTRRVVQARGVVRGIAEKLQQRAGRARTTERDIVGHKDDVLGLLTRRMRQPSSGTTIAAPTSGSAKRKPALPPVQRSPGRSAAIARGAIDFHAPAARQGRASTPDGRTSFHYKHTEVSLGSKLRQSSSRGAVSSGTAAAFQAYVSRASAVAKLEPQVGREPDLEGARAEHGNEPGRLERNVDNEPADPAGRERGGADDLDDFPGNWTRGPKPGDEGFSYPPGWSAGRVHLAVAALQSGTGDAADRDTPVAGAGMFDVSAGDLVLGAQHVPAASMLLHVDEDFGVDRGRFPDLRLRRPGERERQADGGGGGSGFAASLDELFAGPDPAPVRAGTARKVLGDNLTALGDLEDGNGAAGHIHYVARPPAVAKLDSGDNAVFTNMPRDPRECEDLWNRIERSASKSGGDKLAIKQSSDPAFWRAALAQPDCPPEITTALAGKPPGKEVKIASGDLEALAEWVATQPGYKENAPQARLALGRSGIVQIREEIELPHELDMAAQARIMEGLVAPLAAKGVPYYAVIHAPDHNNDPRNKHAHLIYHDRPIAQMDDGRYDFEVSVERESKGKKWLAFPHRQNKDEDLRGPARLAFMRESIAELSNTELAAAGVARRLDPRSYKLMGIEREPMEHLGPTQSALEATGVRTPAGDRNARIQAAGILDGIDKSEQRALADIERRQLLSAQRDRADATLPPLTRDANQSVIDRWSEAAGERVALLHEAQRVEAFDAIARSRAENVIRSADKGLAGIASGAARKFDAGREGDTRLRKMGATRHLDDTKAVMSESLEHAAEWRRLAALENPAIRLGEQLLRQQDQAAERAAAAEAAAREAAKPRYLDKPTMNALVEHAIASRTRIVERDGLCYLDPAVPGPRDHETAANWPLVSTRLAGLKRVQDLIIEEVAAYIGKTPRAISQVSLPDGTSTDKLFHPNPELVRAYNDYRSDPELRAASEVARAHNATEATKQAKKIAADETDERRTVKAWMFKHPGQISVTKDAFALTGKDVPEHVAASAAQWSKHPELVEFAVKASRMHRPPVARPGFAPPVTPAYQAPQVPPAVVATPHTPTPPDTAASGFFYRPEPSAAATAPIAAPATAPAPRPAPEPPAPIAVAPAQPSAREVEYQRLSLIVDAVERREFRIWKDESGGYTLAPEVLKQQQLEQWQLRDIAIQGRLRLIDDSHKAEQALVRGFIKSDPDRAWIDDGRLRLLGSDVPENVAAALVPWAQEPALLRYTSDLHRADAAVRAAEAAIKNEAHRQRIADAQQAVAARQKAAQAAAAKDVETRVEFALRALATKGIPIKRDGDEFGLSPVDLAALNIDKSMIAGPEIQVRMRAISHSQEIEVNGLAKWMGDHPKQLAILQGNLTLTGEDVPENKWQAAVRWADYPDLIKYAKALIERDRASTAAAMQEQAAAAAKAEAEANRAAELAGVTRRIQTSGHRIIAVKDGFGLAPAALETLKINPATLTPPDAQAGLKLAAAVQDADIRQLHSWIESNGELLTIRHDASTNRTFLNLKNTRESIGSTYIYNLMRQWQEDSATIAIAAKSIKAYEDQQKALAATAEREQAQASANAAVPAKPPVQGPDAKPTGVKFHPGMVQGGRGQDQ